MVSADDVARVPLYAGLSADEQERLARVAADVHLGAGEYAAHEGDERALYAVLEGRIEAVKLTDGVERVVGQRQPGEIFGEVPITLGAGFPVSFRAAEATRVMRVEARDYHALASTAPDLVSAVGKLAAERIGGPRGLHARPLRMADRADRDAAPGPERHPGGARPGVCPRAR
jgi:thioredoxin reductase (NADPH)